MQSTENKPTHVTTGNVFEDLGFTSEEAEILRLKTDLHIEIMKAVKKQKFTPRQLEKVLDVSQPHVSVLLSGKIEKMSTDKLAKYLHRLGRRVTMQTVTLTIPKEVSSGRKASSPKQVMGTLAEAALPAKGRRIAAANRRSVGKKKAKKRA